MIERLAAPVSERDLRDLAHLLLDAVASGAAVSFLDSLGERDAIAWWRRTLEALPSRAAVLVVRDQDGIVGTVQVQPAWAPNQPHRAEIVKMLVHRRARRLGLGARLMDAAEHGARDRGFTLLTLDAKAGTAAESLYRKLGWTELGVIPRYALDPDGRPHDCIFMYKELRAGE